MLDRLSIRRPSEVPSKSCEHIVRCSASLNYLHSRKVAAGANDFTVKVLRLESYPV